MDCASDSTRHSILLFLLTSSGSYEIMVDMELTVGKMYRLSLNCPARPILAEIDVELLDVHDDGQSRSRQGTRVA